MSAKRHTSLEQYLRHTKDILNLYLLQNEQVKWDITNTGEVCSL